MVIDVEVAATYKMPTVCAQGRGDATKFVNGASNEVLYVPTCCIGYHLNHADYVQSQTRRGHGQTWETCNKARSTFAIRQLMNPPIFFSTLRC